MKYTVKFENELFYLFIDDRRIFPFKPSYNTRLKEISNGKSFDIDANLVELKTFPTGSINPIKLTEDRITYFILK